MTEHYLDNSATTPLSSAAQKKITEALSLYGNPSSLHKLGVEAEREISCARAQILEALGPRAKASGELIFTSCGTEATMLALFGVAHAKARRTATRILTTDSEHPSVENAMKRLEEEGFEVLRLPTRGGVLDMTALTAALDKPIFLASFMLVNNETGARYAVEEAFTKIKQTYPDAVTHCDAVQGFLKVPFTAASLGADLITLSGHKVHAPKGIGALYVASSLLKAKKIIPYVVGGGQEKGLRSGTENTLGILAFGAAVSDLWEKRQELSERILSLRTLLCEKLEPLEIRLNLPPVSAPHILNLTLPRIKSETMLHFLSAKGIYVSSGSACSSHDKKTSASLLAFGLDAAQADCSLRVSLSGETAEEDILALAEALAEGISSLVRIR